MSEVAQPQPSPIFHMINGHASGPHTPIHTSHIAIVYSLFLFPSLLSALIRFFGWLQVSAASSQPSNNILLPRFLQLPLMDKSVYVIVYPLTLALFLSRD